ncbi:universal stress protein [Hydrogenothermus marinus]|uniref:Nucleotide-binding universal stress UspA family protein n=1 Tax=Hydrogenothermus marinus TaxID=133270 RepID=A0A3M0BQE7_9AQUI|nr:universal stress protein [Hydrogenothermus marinus]RMA97048.1 nucleotide-binding universal stress UspA family protein [Hydrogenothermus marinus]
MINRILVGIDGSKYSKIAEDYGIWLSKKLKKPVVGVHIIDIRLLEGPFIEDLAGALGFTIYSDLTPKVKEFFEERADILLKEFAQKCREKGADCTIAKAFGLVAKELTEMADPEDLIIVGKRGQHPQFEFLLGSTAEAVARKSKCPVLITTDKFSEIKNILLAFDGREKSIHAAQYINSFAKDLGIESIDVITVSDDKVIDTFCKEGQPVEDAVKDILKNYLTDIEFNIHILKGYPEEEIENYIKENQDKYDLAVLGAFGESRIKELILGSTTSYIMQKSPIPLLLVK